MPNEQEDVKFLKWRSKILALNTGDQPDRLDHDIIVPAFRGYATNARIPAGTPLKDIINIEFNTPAPQPKVTIVVSPTGSGTTNPSGTQTVAYGADFNFTSATPNPGYQLKQITVDGETKTAPFTIRNVTADLTVNVEFEEQAPTPTFTVTGVAGEHGSISPTLQTFNENDPVNITFTATPASGYQVDKWLLNGTPDQTGGDTFPLVIDHITASQEVKVLFTEIPVVPTYTITAQVDGGHGSVAPISAGEYEEGTAVEAKTFTATPDTGYEVEKWFVNDTEQTGQTGLTFTLPAISSITENKVVKVKFKEIVADKYYLTVTDATTGITNYGTLDPAASATRYEYVVGGTAASVTATPNSGFRIKSFKVAGVEQTISDPTQAFTYTLNGVEVVKDASTTVVVEFEEVPSGKFYTLLTGVKPAATTITGDFAEEEHDPSETSIDFHVHGGSTLGTKASIAFPADKGTLQSVTFDAWEGGIPDAGYLATCTVTDITYNGVPYKFVTTGGLAKNANIRLTFKW